MSRRTLAVCLGPALFASPALAQGIIASGFLPGGDHTEAIGISADGRIVVGATSMSDGSGHAYRWAPGQPLQDLGTGGAMGTSADGSVVVGFDFASQATRWTADTGVQPLGNLSGDIFSRANACSADGSIIVGFSVFQENSESSASARACLWTASGIQALGPIPGFDSQGAAAVSADGTVIAVNALITGSSADSNRAYRWTAGTGYLPLGTLGAYCEAAAASGDGATIVGQSTISGISSHAFCWMAATGIKDLGALPGETWSAARGVNGDGTVIVGNGMAAGASHALMWTPRLGVVDLNTYLPSIGINVGPWVLNYGLGVSADGRVIMGAGKRGPNWEGWVVTVPCYANCDLSTNTPALTANDFQCFLNEFASGDPYANCDGSSGTPVLTANDFQCFLNQFATGCS